MVGDVRILGAANGDPSFLLIALHSRFPVMKSRAGRAVVIEELLLMYLGTTLREPPNGLSLWEGLKAITAEHLGLAAYGLQETLLQSCGPKPGGDPVINVLPACPASLSNSPARLPGYSSAWKRNLKRGRSD